MAKIELKVYEEKDAGVWDQFVDMSINGTIFHKRKFLSYHPPERFKDSSLLFCKANKLIGVFPAAIIQLDGKEKVLKSHPGASYGGLVVDSPPGLEYANQIVEKLIAFGLGTDCKRIEFRLAPKIYDISFCDELDFAYTLNGFTIENLELSTCYDLRMLGGGQVNDDRIIQTFKASCRRSTKKALKECLVARLCQAEEDFMDYWSILAKNLENYNVTPTHSRVELLDLKARFPHEIQLIGVFDGNRMIAGIITFVANANATHVFYFASLYEYQDKRPLNLGVLKLIQFAAARKLKFVNFGISTEHSGRHVNWGLFRFKESFGGSGVLRSYWAKQL